MDILSTLDVDPLWVSSFAVLAAVTLVLVGVRSVNKSKNNKSTKDLYGIQMYPGSIRDFFGHFFSWDGPQHVLSTVRKLKDPIFRVPMPPGAPPLYIVADAVVARTVLQDSSSTKWDDANRFFVDTTDGMNFIAAQNHRWKHVRKSTVAAFSSENIKLMVHVVEEVMDTWIKEVFGDASMDGGINIDILSEMNKITSNVICQAAFDYDLDNKERQIFLSDLKVCWVEFGQNAGKNPLRRYRFTKWAFRGVRDGHRAAKRLHSRCAKMLQEYRARLPGGAQPHKIIHMINEDADYANDHERVSDMLAFVIAGFDTTANTLAFCFRELALNQKEQTKLRESIRRCHTPKEARVAVKGVIREIMRLYPGAASGSVRVSGKDIKIGGSAKANGVLPKGSLVVTSYYAIQRDPNIFGRDADKFVPIRWDKPTAEQTAAFLTFSAGTRNCLGQSLALAEMTEVVARLCRDYQFDIVKAGQAESLVLFKPIGTILKATQVPNS